MIATVRDCPFLFTLRPETRAGCKRRMLLLREVNFVHLGALAKNPIW